MKKLQQIIDFYLHASIHVALATMALVYITYYYANVNVNCKMIEFVFLSTLASYNIIKYSSFVKKNNLFSAYKLSLKIIVIFTILALFLCGILFVQFKSITQLFVLFVGLLTILYALPIRKKSRNLRNFPSIKIYIVSICWAVTTFLIPLLEENVVLNGSLIIQFIQRFILVFSLILIFDIVDLKYDNANLHTLPQAIGVRKTKYVIYCLISLFSFLEVLITESSIKDYFINLILSAIVIVFTYFASTKRKKYYSLFWVEAVPFFWLFIMLILNATLKINS